PGIWKSISNARYRQDKGEKLYRRSMYTYWRRTVPPPMMMAFNAAARETCVVRTDQTTTPLQALTMMNNITFVEAARCLAERVLRDSRLSSRRRLHNAFRMVTSRQQLPEELDRLQADLQYYQRHFRDNPKAATRLLAIGERRPDPAVNTTRLAAFTLVTNTIMNLDEAIMEN
ncbi:MAG: DUF1553 domain-containing protein, partial [Planctomycetota bacterium]|nr:DUF1553 domain-containing protein [Planctomycetota bacterium]